MIESTRDFGLGAALVAAMFVVYQAVSFFSIPSEKEIEKRATAPIPLIGGSEANDKITVWGFQEGTTYSSFSQPDGSPYVVRVECYLRLLGKEYVKAKTAGMQENPRGKVPFANIHGTMVDDSFRIMTAIAKHYDVDPDAGLTEQQKTTGHLIRRMLCGNFYWVCLSHAFGTMHGRSLVRAEFAKAIPGFILPILMALVTKTEVNKLDAQGIGRYPRAEVVEMGKGDLRVLANILGKNTYILGTKEATAYDSDVYAFVGHVFHNQSTHDLAWVTEIKQELPSLTKYIERMRSLLFELKAKTN